MKTLIEIRREIWGKVKDLATVRNISVNLAVEQLLTKALVDSGYLLGGGGPSEDSKLNQNGFDVSKGQDIICEASECYAKATDKVTVTVGTLGVISLALCNDCVSKFKETTLA